MGIYIPPKKVNNEDNSFFGQIAKPVQGLGSIASLLSVIPGPQAPIAQAIATGANAAGTLHNANQQQQQQQAPQQPKALPEQGQDAISRKLSSMNENPSSRLLQAGQALNSLPQDAQEEYRPILSKAYSTLRMRG